MIKYRKGLKLVRINNRNSIIVLDKKTGGGWQTRLLSSKRTHFMLEKMMRKYYIVM